MTTREIEEIERSAKGLRAYASDIMLSYLSTSDALKMARWLEHYTVLLKAEERRARAREMHREYEGRGL